MDTAATIPTGSMAERLPLEAVRRLRPVHLGDPVPDLRRLGVGRRLPAPARARSGFGSGYVDFAGSGVVHSIGGWCALAGAIVLGPRIGKYNKDGSRNTILGHNQILAILGTFILAFGWFGFNPGSTFGASGNGALRIGIVAVVTHARLRLRRVLGDVLHVVDGGQAEPGMMVNGMLAGLVAITAPSATSVRSRPRSSASSPASWSASRSPSSTGSHDRRSGRRDLRPRRQRPVGRPRDRASSPTARRTTAASRSAACSTATSGQLGAQVIGAAVAFVWAFGASLVFFKVLNRFVKLRVSPEVELGGLDIPEMGMLGYVPDGIPAAA